MIIKLLEKTILTLIALSMLIISLSMWRYQGDIHHITHRVFASDKNYPEDIYNVLWAMHSQDNHTSTIEMQEITLSKLPSKLLNRTISHPSESIIASIIDDPLWEKFVPNSKNSTYRAFQTFWISRYIDIKEVMNYRLRGVEEEALKRFNKPIEELDIYETVVLLNAQKNDSDKLLDQVNKTIERLHKVFPERYKSLHKQ